MRLQTLLLLPLAVLLASCAANFGSHLEAMKAKGALSASGKAPSFTIDETESVDGEKGRSDPTTSRLIAERLVEIGMKRRADQSDLASAVVTYRQLLGWNLGEIVERMTICAETKSETSAQRDCASFSGMGMANTHPTRKLVVDNLLAILLTSRWPPEADTAQYSRTSKTPRIVVDPD